MTDEVRAAPMVKPLPTDFLGWLLRPEAHPRVRQAATAYVVGSTAWVVGKKAYDRWNTSRKFTVAVSGEDEIFQEVTTALYSVMPPVNYRSVEAKSYRLNGHARSDSPLAVAGFDVAEPGASTVARAVRMIGDRELEQPVFIDGHRIMVKFTKERYLSLSEAKQRGSGVQEKRIEMTAPSAEARDAIVAWLGRLAETSGEDPPRLFIASRWGSWERRNDLPARKLETVILAAGQREAIVADLDQFFRDEEAYATIGMPWHRGYLFYGPGGTGKTSIARAVADHFGMDVYYLPLSDMTSDTNLLQLVAGIKARSMLLLEDIDTAHAATEREEAETEASASMSGLLNSLDGVATPHGLVTVMTTNHIDRLDETLIREGRADLKFEVSYVDRDQVSRLSHMFYGEPFDLQTRVLQDDAIRAAEITPAQVVEIFKTHLSSQTTANFAFLELVKSKVPDGFK